MRRLLKPLGLALGLFAITTVVGSCATDLSTNPGLRATHGMANSHLPAVRIAEIHYDNTGTDVGEAIEVSFPTGTDLSSYSIVLYNGNGGAPYNTQALGGFAPASCGDRSVVVVTYPTDG